LFQRRSGSNKGDVQILSLDGESRREETFRREGDAEILELQRRERDVDDDDDLEVTSMNGDEDDDRRHPASRSSTSSSTAASSVTPRRQLRKSGLDVLPEEDDESLSRDAVTPNGVPLRKLSENKSLQTDITYGKANKRIQVWTTSFFDLNKYRSKARQLTIPC
jgi:hypothetical protein